MREDVYLRKIKKTGDIFFTRFILKLGLFQNERVAFVVFFEGETVAEDFFDVGECCFFFAGKNNFAIFEC